MSRRLNYIFDNETFDIWSEKQKFYNKKAV